MLGFDGTSELCADEDRTIAWLGKQSEYTALVQLFSFRCNSGGSSLLVLPVLPLADVSDIRSQSLLIYLLIEKFTTDSKCALETRFLGPLGATWTVPARV